MPTMRFDVNDSDLRRAMLTEAAPQALAELRHDSAARWGDMTPQEMVEHLLWTFELSCGGVDVECSTPSRLLYRARRFLSDDRRTPHGFRNPLLLAGLPPLRFATLQEATSALLAEMDLFLQQAPAHETVRRIHPIFGPLDMEEWSRVHFKHVFHHLEQFGLIEEAAAR